HEPYTHFRWSLEDNAGLAAATKPFVMGGNLKKHPFPGAILQSPTPYRYRRAQMVFEGLDYCIRLPHRPIERDINAFALRTEALGALNDQLAHPGTQTSDAILLTVVALLITSMQSSAHPEWRAHLEGARRIIQLRGGLKIIIEDNPYFKPVLFYFIMADVMGATTCSSRHEKMSVATLMAMKYWEMEPNILRLLAATPNPCHEEIFQSIILSNYLRTIAHSEKLQKGRQSGTRMVLAKILRFSPTEYAARMHNFTGWKPNGKDVGFASSSPDEPRPLPTAPNSQPSSRSSEPSPASADSSPSRISDQDLWFSVAAVYHAATLIYGLRTLVVDAQETDKTLLLPEGKTAADVAALREEACRTLTDILTPVFSDHTTMYRIGKLVMWPLFILGTEVKLPRLGSADVLRRGLHDAEVILWGSSAPSVPLTSSRTSGRSTRRGMGALG
ncbi:hypothetical protein PG996_009243, partial [Apiospora saccharicola]